MYENMFFLSHFTHKRIGTKLVNDNSRLLFADVRSLGISETSDSVFDDFAMIFKSENFD